MKISAGGKYIFTPTDLGWSNAALATGATTAGTVFDAEDCQNITFYVGLTDAAAGTLVLRLRLSDEFGVFGANGLSIDSGSVVTALGSNALRYTFGLLSTQTSGGGLVGSEPICLSRFLRLDLTKGGVGANATALFVRGWASAIR